MSTKTSSWTTPARRPSRLHTLAASLRQHLHRDRWLRLHIVVIALLTLAGLWLTSAALLLGGVGSLGLRYAFALPVAYGLYLLLLRLWAHELARGSNPLCSDMLDLVDLPQHLACHRSGAEALPSAETLTDAAGQALHRSGSAFKHLDLDEGVIVVVPLAVVLGLGVLLAGLLGTGVFMLFGVEVLLAVTVEVALASVAGSLAYKGVTEGWLASALRHTGRGFLLVWVLAVLLGVGIDHWLPEALSLPHALRMVWGTP